MKFRPRLSAVLLTVNLAIIAIPFGSIFFFRIYENQLVQETERELISQAAMIGAFYRQSMLGSVADTPRQSAAAVQERATRSVAARSREVARGASITGAYAPPMSPWTPINPRLDLAKVATLVSRPDGMPPTALPSAAAASAGRALSPLLDRAQRTTLIGVRVLDRHGTTVGGTAEVGLNFAHVEEVAVALAGRYASALRARELANAPSELSTISRGTGVRVFVAYPVMEGARVLGVVYLSRTPKSIVRHVYDERVNAALAFATILVLTVSLGMLTSRTISRPVAELLARMRRVASGESAAIKPLEHPGTREMAELSDGISQMATALSDRAGYIRTLASQVSHEFKTPLTSIEGAAELLHDHYDTMTAEERQRFLDNISGDSARLRTLLDRLLDLARADNLARSEERAGLRDAVRRAASALPEGITTDENIPDGLSVRITDEALGIVLGNLLDNAVQHGATHIAIAAATGDGAATVTVADNGRGITPANREKIFEHFFTTRRETGGTGLGLGIIQALLSAHGGAIELIDRDSPGAAFVVTLKI